ncbi:MAG: PAS domain S-box protein [Candidatus Desulfofervidus sp.]|nr:PAS domain S-box protein [Candidatus Desulfofervidus sp.]
MELKEKKKRKRETLLIFILIPIIGFLIYIESKSFNPDFQLRITNTFLFFILANLNIILLILFVFLVTRNFVKLIAERKRGIVGSRIRTKLVLLFVGLSLLPTMVLFGVAAKFVFSSFNYWFNIKVEQAINQTLEIGHIYYKQASDDLIHYSKLFQRGFINNGELIFDNVFLSKLRPKLKEYNLDLLQVYNYKLQPLVSLTRKPVEQNLDLKNDLAEPLKTREPVALVKSLPYGDLAYTITPLEKGRLWGFLVVGRLIPPHLVKKLEAIRKNSEDYKQLFLFVNPLKWSLFIIFSVITLLVIFVATWVGFRIAKVITIPIQALAGATQEVAKGNLDVNVDVEASDEVKMLVDSFNKMVTDLRMAYGRLQEQKLEIERRHKYTKTILENIRTGVISTSASGYIITVNPAVEEILGVKAGNLVGRPFQDLAEIFPEFKEFSQIISEKLEKQIKLKINGRLLTLVVSTTLLKDKQGQPLGAVFVFEDITQLEKIQRMAAWREVARRIAHEIKNPLTPIQLSAQRLRRRYLNQFQGESVFDECTQMIVKQVEGLKKMVNEFSNLARLPEVNLTLNNLAEVIEEALAVYRSAHLHITFELNQITSVPMFLFDREQIKRALLNLLDNAVASIEDQGKIEVAISHDPAFKIVRIEVKDTGQGIPDELKPRLFEPYFSTKRSGTGLGLTIVHTIISDHQGFIRVKDNYPQGSIFAIELPLRS